MTVKYLIYERNQKPNFLESYNILCVSWLQLNLQQTPAADLIMSAIGLSAFTCKKLFIKADKL